MKLIYATNIFIAIVLGLNFQLCFAINKSQNNQGVNLLLTKDLGWPDTLKVAKDKFFLFDFGKYVPDGSSFNNRGFFYSVQKCFTKRISSGLIAQFTKIEKSKKGCEAQFSQAVRLVQRNKPERLRSMGAREVIDSMRESNIAVSTGCVCMVRAYRRNEWTTAEKVSVLEWLL